MCHFTKDGHLAAVASHFDKFYEVQSELILFYFLLEPLEALNICRDVNKSDRLKMSNKNLQNNINILRLSQVMRELMDVCLDVSLEILKVQDISINSSQTIHILFCFL